MSVDDLDESSFPLAAANGNGTSPNAVRARSSLRAQPRRAARTHRRRWPIVTTSLVVLLAVIIGGGYVAWRWSQDQYYVGADSKGEVVIYRGVNQRIVGISLSKPYEVTEIRLSQVPSPYQQTVTATDAASSLSDAQAIVTNVAAAVSTCKQQYTALESWATQENQYQAKLALAKKNKKKTKGITPPGQQPQKAGGMCPPSTAFGIAASALTPTLSGQS
jgi:hypothetical protein